MRPDFQFVNTKPKLRGEGARRLRGVTPIWGTGRIPDTNKLTRNM